ncbi:MAG: hypothetical protein HC901_02550, partial [Bdellovibrionaceae bacterium]|nr:hypothetical protein [Pseudobdellovibrionaceae bacterium]
MGSRARWVALLVIAAYGLFCFYYYSFFVAPKAHGVILFLAPGLTLDALGRAQSTAGTEGLLVMRARQTALVHNGSLGDIPADSLYTLLATGTAPGGDDDRLPPSLLYLAERRGRLTGLISSSRLTDPAPAAFYHGKYHRPSRPQLATFLGDLLQGRDINFVAGAVGQDFRLAGSFAKREAIQQVGYYYANSPTELEDAPAWRTRH